MTNEKSSPAGEVSKQDPKHHNWLDDLVDRIQKLDTEFPLSGGETEEDLEKVEGKKDEHHKKTSFFDDLDTEFPLSGGEIDR